MTQIPSGLAVDPPAAKRWWTRHSIPFKFRARNWALIAYKRSAALWQDLKLAVY